MKLPAPESFAAVSRNAQLDLSWKAVENAASYSIKKWNETSGSYELVAKEITGTTYRVGGLANGQTYRYVVAATNVAGEEKNQRLLKLLRNLLWEHLSFPRKLVTV